MTTIIQTGYYTSKSQELMSELNKRGLNKPLNSISYNLTYSEIVGKIDRIVSKENYDSRTNKLPHNLMMDLMIANIELDSWGWSDESNLKVLDLWKELDNDILFILVFDHPKYIINHLTNDSISKKNLSMVINNWVEYHESMLRFFEENRENSILIEGVSLNENLNEIKGLVESHANGLKLKSGWQVLSDSSGIIDNDCYNSSFLNLLGKELVVEYPLLNEIYDTLVSKADIKINDKLIDSKITVFEDLIVAISDYKRINIDRDYKKENNDLKEKLDKSNKENDALQNKLNEAAKNKDNINKDFNRIKESIKSHELKNNELEKKLRQNEKIYNHLEASYGRLAAQIQDANNENSLLIKQIHVLQAKLEPHLNLNEVIQPEKNTPKPMYYGAADRIKQDLPYKLGSKVVKSVYSPTTLIKLPKDLYKEVSNFKKNSNVDSLPSISDYEDAHEAEKIKQHLSYQVGKSIVDALQSPKKALTLPLKLSQDIVLFKAKKKDKSS